jgi:hypothetical protein
MKKKLTGTMQSVHVQSGILVHGCPPRRPLLPQPGPGLHKDLATAGGQPRRRGAQCASRGKSTMPGWLRAITPCTIAGRWRGGKDHASRDLEHDPIVSDHAPARAGTPRLWHNGRALAAMAIVPEYRAPLLVVIIGAIVSIVRVVPVIAARCQRERNRSQASGGARSRCGRVPIPMVAPAVVTISVMIPAIVPIVMAVVITGLFYRYWWRYNLRARHAHRAG